jgi:putative ABC transport system permease protein
MTLVAVATGAMTILLFGGFAAAIIHGVETGVVRQTGHLQVQKRGYFEFGTGAPAEFGIPNYQQVIDVLSRDPELAAMLRVATPVLAVQGIAGNFSAGVSRTIAGLGIIVKDVNRMRRWNPYAFPGETKPLALPEDRDDLVVIGQGLARALQLAPLLNVPGSVAFQPEEQKIRNKPEALPLDLQELAKTEGAGQSPPSSAHLELLAATSSGTPNVAGVGIAAAENQGMKEVDDMYVGLPLSLAQHLVYGQSPPQATAVVLQLESSDVIPRARARAQSLVVGQNWDFEIHDFRTINPTYDQIKGLFASMFTFMALLMGTIVLFGVANTMTMAVMERTTEIGTIRSMGVQRGGVSRLFMTEGLLIGCIGTFAGTAAALLIAVIVNNSGLKWTPPGQVESIPLVLHVLNSPTLIFGTVVGLVLLASVSAVLPARHASHLPIVDALRHV